MTANQLQALLLPSCSACIASLASSPTASLEAPAAAGARPIRVLLSICPAVQTLWRRQPCRQLSQQQSQLLSVGGTHRACQPCCQGCCRAARYQTSLAQMVLAPVRSSGSTTKRFWQDLAPVAVEGAVACASARAIQTTSMIPASPATTKSFPAASLMIVARPPPAAVSNNCSSRCDD